MRVWPSTASWSPARPILRGWKTAMVKIERDGPRRSTSGRRISGPHATWPASASPVNRRWKVDQSCPGPPGRECVLDHVIPMKARPPEPSAQHVLRPDIVAWEDLEPSEPSEENVLGRPASDAS